MKKSLYIAASLLVLAACTRETDIEVPAGDMTITARTETSADTRTVVEGETHVYWEPGDAIKVFSDGKSGKFTTDITEASASATFNGSLPLTEGADIWAVYPYSEDAVFHGETLDVVLPSEQVAREGSFGKDMNLAIAHSTTNTLQFYNVGGGVRFSLSDDGITEVMFEGVNRETVAGTFEVGFQNGKPVILDFWEEFTAITITPPDGRTFKKDTWYYIVAIPGAFDNGFVFHFRKASDWDIEIPYRTYSKSVTIKRSVYGQLTYADKGPWGPYAVPDIVDLGLPSGRKWASFNLGATKPEEYGYLFAWGETDPFERHRRYKWHKENLLTKYCTVSDDGYLGFTDDKTTLVPEDDAAHVNLGEKWRMPLIEEIQELLTECSWEWAQMNGINGRKVTGPNGNSIFLPAAGATAAGCDFGIYGYYWSSSLNTGNPKLALDLEFDEITGVCQGWFQRAAGMSIRPVYDDGTIIPPSPETPVPEAIDMGTSVKWASFNVGATKPEESGDFYAWGETDPQYIYLNPLTLKEGIEEGYAWESYKWSKGSNKTLTKYCSVPELGYNGFTDGKTVLEMEDDAANVAYGGNWRIPTNAEWNELLDNCTFVWTTENGVEGRRYTSKKTGNSIFLPAPGYLWYSRYGNSYSGNYWSSSLIEIQEYSAYAFSFNFQDNGRDLEIIHGARCGGLTIRAVCDGSSSNPPTPVPDPVDLGLPSGLKWASFNLGASKPEGYGDYYAWGETETYYFPGEAQSDYPTWKIGKEEGYWWSSYKWCKGSNTTITKYWATSYSGYEYMDGKTLLDPEDDAAHMNLGGSWRMPTEAEWTELRENCSWEWTSMNSIHGRKVTGPNGNSIFFPAAGRRIDTTLDYLDNEGLYWSSSLFFDYPDLALTVSFYSNEVIGDHESRRVGLSVRPVCN